MQTFSPICSHMNPYAVMCSICSHMNPSLSLALMSLTTYANMQHGELHLIAYACMCLHMAAHDGDMLHVVAYGCTCCICLHMVAYCCVWQHMAAIQPRLQACSMASRTIPCPYERKTGGPFNGKMGPTNMLRAIDLPFGKFIEMVFGAQE